MLFVVLVMQGFQSGVHCDLKCLGNVEHALSQIQT